jgi:hypothetical protein
VTSTPLGSVLADDLLLDRVGARLDCDDELGSLLLSVARHVDAPITHPAVRARRGRRRGLVVLTALGVAVSGATVAAALETAPGPPAPAGNPSHTRFLPRDLQALGLPFTGSGLVPGRLLVPGGPSLLGVTGPTGMTPGVGTTVASGPSATSLPTLLLIHSADGADGADAVPAGDGDGRASDPVVASPSSVVPAADQKPSATGANGSSRTTAVPGKGVTEGEEEAVAAASSPPTGAPSVTPTTPTSRNANATTFAGTGTGGQKAVHAATAMPTSTPKPTAPTTPTTPAVTSTSRSTPANGGSVDTSRGKGVAVAAAKGRPADIATSTAATSTPTTSTPTRSASPTVRATAP